MFIVLGFKSHNVNADPAVIYCGRDGAKAQEAIEKTANMGFIKIGKVVHPMLIPVAVPQAEKSATHKTEEKAKK
jgi:hypothetical protein